MIVMYRQVNDSSKNNLTISDNNYNSYYSSFSIILIACNGYQVNILESPQIDNTPEFALS